MIPTVQLVYTLSDVEVNIYVEEAFTVAYDDAKQYSGIGPYRMRQLWASVGQVAKLPAGDFLEVGIYRGGSSLLLLHALKYFQVEGTLYSCDTFQGLVKASSDKDIWKTGQMAHTEEDEVRERLQGATILKGTFPEDTGHSVYTNKFRLAHIDVDTYQSAKDIWKWLWPRLVPGGVVIFDDCEISDTPGITELISELEATPKTFWLRNHMGQAVCVKL